MHQKRIRDLAQLVDRLYLHPVTQVAAPHATGGVEQGGDRHINLAGQEQGDPGGDEEDEQRD